MEVKTCVWDSANLQCLISIHPEFKYVSGYRQICFCSFICLIWKINNYLVESIKKDEQLWFFGVNFSPPPPTGHQIIIFLIHIRNKCLHLTCHMLLTKDKINVFSIPIRKLLNIIDSCLFHLNPLLVQTLQQIHKLNTVRKINYRGFRVHDTNCTKVKEYMTQIPH